MIKIVSNRLNIDDQKILNKWKHVLESAGFTSSEYEESMLTKISYYFENHSINEIAYVNPPQPLNSNLNGGITTLPVSIKLFKKLNLKGKNLQISNSPTFQYLKPGQTETSSGTIGAISHHISVDFDSLQKNSPAYISSIEDLLIKETADIINLQLNRHDTIVIYMLAQSIYISGNESKSEDTNLCITCRICFMDEKEKLEHIYMVNNVTNELEKFQKIDNSNLVIAKDGSGKEYLLDMRNQTIINGFTEQRILSELDKMKLECERLQKRIKQYTSTIIGF